MATPIMSSLVGQVQTITRTNKRNYISPAEMNAYIDGAQQQLQNFLIGLIEAYKPRMPVPAVASQITSDVNELLEPFRTRYPAVPISGRFQITFDPSKPMIKTEAYIADDFKVTIPTAGREESFTRSRIRVPSIQKPIGQFVGGFLMEVTPLPTVLVTQYIHSAPAAVVTYNADYTINQATSQELLWSMRAVPYLLYFIMKNFGISVNAPYLVQFSKDNLNIAV